MNQLEHPLVVESLLSQIEKSDIIKGHDFNKSNRFSDIAESLKTNGIMSDNLYKAIQIIKRML